MLLTAILTDQVTIYPVSSSSADRYGDEVPSRGEGVTVPARVEPLRSPKGDLELLAGRDTFITEYTMFTQATDALTGSSEVEWQGDTYQVNGHPKAFKDVLGRVSHCETYLRRIEG